MKSYTSIALIYNFKKTIFIDDKQFNILSLPLIYQPMAKICGTEGVKHRKGGSGK